METFTGRNCVRFLGENIYYEDPRHAAALQRASDILNEIVACNLTADELGELLRVLRRYFRYSAARKLEERARMHVDLRRPPHPR